MYSNQFVSFIITAKAYFNFPLKDMHADVDDALTWRCEAVSRPRAAYTWYKNTQVLSSIAGELEIRGNVLKIKKLHPAKHNGMYQCAATNPHGTTFSSGQLRVLC
jgi:hypothetical protein